MLSAIRVPPELQKNAARIFLFNSTIIFFFTFVVDPDPHWFWSAGSGSRIRNVELDLAKKTHKKVEKFHALKYWMLSFEGWRLLL
jgi:hypothetical protein